MTAAAVAILIIVLFCVISIVFVLFCFHVMVTNLLILSFSFHIEWFYLVLERRSKLTLIVSHPLSHHKQSSLATGHDTQDVVNKKIMWATDIA